MPITREQSDDLAEKVVTAIDELEATMPVDIRHDEQMRQYRECVSKVLFESLNAAAACILAVLLFVGCSAPASDATDYQPLAAAVIATSGTAPVPVPVNPNPPSGICTNCNGTGKLGDGTIFVNCPVCGGDGKISENDDLKDRIKILEGAAQRLTEERDTALRERDQANATIRSMADESKRLVAATGKAMANCAGSVPVTQQRTYTQRRRGLLGRR